MWIIALIVGLVLGYLEHLDDEEREQEERMYNTCISGGGSWYQNDKAETIVEDSAGTRRIVFSSDNGYACVMWVDEDDENEDEESEEE